MTSAAEVKPQARMIDQILAGAERAFLASGYDLATMDSVARHAGVARASVYNNFTGKEALFLAVMQRGIDGFVARAVGRDDPALPPMSRLRAVGANFLRAATQPDAVEMYRMVAALGPRFPQLGRTLHARGLARIEDEFRALAELARIAHPQRFAGQLLALLMGGFFGRRLLGIGGDPRDADIETYVDAALAALAPGA